MSELIHGKPATYNNHKCRCHTSDGLFVDPQTMGCTEAWAEYIRERGYVKRYQQRKRDAKSSAIGCLSANETPESKELAVDFTDPNVGYDNPLELF